MTLRGARGDITHIDVLQINQHAWWTACGIKVGPGRMHVLGSSRACKRCYEPSPLHRLLFAR